MKSFLFVLALTTLATACYRSPIGMPLPERARLESEWKNYTRLQPSKALAIAGDMRGTYVIGYAFALESEPDAVNQAMLACEARRADRRIEAPCRTFAVGDRALDAPLLTRATPQP
jgi:hypothetical protein